MFWIGSRYQVYLGAICVLLLQRYLADRFSRKVRMFDIGDKEIGN